MILQVKVVSAKSQCKFLSYRTGSQDSNSGMCWTQYSIGGGSISTQSSQEECPEAMVEMGGAELARNHALITLDKCVVTRIPKPMYRWVALCMSYLQAPIYTNIQSHIIL